MKYIKKYILCKCNNIRKTNYDLMAKRKCSKPGLGLWIRNIDDEQIYVELNPEALVSDILSQIKKSNFAWGNFYFGGVLLLMDSNLSESGICCECTINFIPIDPDIGFWSYGIGFFVSENNVSYTTSCFVGNLIINLEKSLMIEKVYKCKHEHEALRHCEKDVGIKATYETETSKFTVIVYFDDNGINYMIDHKTDLYIYLKRNLDGYSELMIENCYRIRSPYIPVPVIEIFNEDEERSLDFFYGY